MNVRRGQFFRRKACGVRAINRGMSSARGGVQDVNDRTKEKAAPLRGRGYAGWTRASGGSLSDSQYIPSCPTVWMKRSKSTGFRM